MVQPKLHRVNSGFQLPLNIATDPLCWGRWWGLPSGGDGSRLKCILERKSGTRNQHTELFWRCWQGAFPGFSGASWSSGLVGVAVARCWETIGLGASILYVIFFREDIGARRRQSVSHTEGQNPSRAKWTTFQGWGIAKPVQFTVYSILGLLDNGVRAAITTFLAFLIKNRVTAGAVGGLMSLTFFGRRFGKTTVRDANTEIWHQKNHYSDRVTDGAWLFRTTFNPVGMGPGVVPTTIWIYVKWDIFCNLCWNGTDTHAGIS